MSLEKAIKHGKEKRGMRSELCMEPWQKWKTRTAPDGVIFYKDPGTRKVKKNRHRHIKDKAPKSMRGRSDISDNDN